MCKLTFHQTKETRMFDFSCRLNNTNRPSNNQYAKWKMKWNPFKLQKSLVSDGYFLVVIFFYPSLILKQQAGKNGYIWRDDKVRITLSFHLLSYTASMYRSTHLSQTCLTQKTLITRSIWPVPSNSFFMTTYKNM